MDNRTIWNKRYLNGNLYNKGTLLDYTTRYMWDIINNFAKDDIRKECIDVGCGDLSFWRYKLFFYRPCEKYIGIDISDFIMKKNWKRFRKHKNRRFILASSDVFLSELSSKVVLCSDLLFHIMDDDTYIQTIVNLCRYSKKWIIITNWYKEPIPYNKTFQKYRDFKKYQYIFEEYGFVLIRSFKVPSNDTGKIYVYKKDDKI